MKFSFPLPAQVLSFALLGASLTLLLGKDTNEDLLNYHLYTAHAFLNYDLASDFMGSSAQRYLNPIGYLPFYFMFQAGWHSVLIGIVLGSFQGMALFFLWRILRGQVFADTARANTWSIASLFFAMSSPVYLGVLGGTFLDGTTLVFIMAGLMLACSRVGGDKTPKAAMFWAGILFGIATGLKLTSVIFGIATAVVFIVAMRGTKQGWVDVGRFVIGSFVATVASSGFWFYKLYQEFGNPVFPLFNHVFKSPDFTTAIATHSRFMVSNLEELVTLPFRMASVHSWIYVESAAPDLRFAVIAIVAIALALLALHARIRRAASRVMAGSAQRTAPDARNSSVGAYLVMTWMAMFALWQMTSGNGRYALPVMLLAGPVVVLLVRRLTISDASQLRILIVIGALQLFHVVSAGNPRWTTEAWHPKWLDITVASKLAAEPYGFLTTGINTQSAAALYFHPDSRMTNILGVYPIDPKSPAGHRVRQFIQKYEPNLRVMFETAPGAMRDGLLPNLVPGINEQIAGWDLLVDANQCELIRIPHLLKNGAELAACLVVKGNPSRDQIEATRQRITMAFDSVEAACPMLFSPRGGYVLRKAGRWVREYPAYDIRLYMQRGRITFTRFEYGPFDVDLGSLVDWETGRGKVDCKIPDRPFSF